MNTKLRREIFIETNQIAFLFTHSERSLRLCPVCNGKSIMISPSTLAEVLNISSREIYRLIEGGELHFIEDERRRMFVCLNVFTEECSTQEGSKLKKLVKRNV